MRVIGLATLTLFLFGGTLGAQSTRARAEASLLAQGWTLLAKGDAAKASAVAADLLARHPRSVAVLALAVEAGVAHRGATAGLEAYERWLDTRKVEDGYGLRRVAQALLREAARNQNDPLAASQAVDALIADGDPEVPVKADSGGAPGNVTEAALQAELGNERAIDTLMEALKAPTPIKARAITGLAKSRNPRAVKPLIEILNDPDPLARAAAAEALGRMGAAEAIPALKQLLNDEVFNVHLAAAGALLTLKDTSGVSWLQQLQASEHAGVRLASAQAARSDPDSNWLEVVRGLTNDRDPEIRRQAAVLIAPHDPETARATLEPLLQDANPAQREAAATSYLQSVVSDFAALRGFLRSAETSARVQAAARILALTR